MALFDNKVLPKTTSATSTGIGSSSTTTPDSKPTGFPSELLSGRPSTRQPTTQNTASRMSPRKSIGEIPSILAMSMPAASNPTPPVDLKDNTVPAPVVAKRASERRQVSPTDALTIEPAVTDNVSTRETQLQTTKALATAHPPLEAFLARAIATYPPGADESQQDRLKNEWLETYRPWVNDMMAIEGNGFDLNRDARADWRPALIEAAIIGLAGLLSSFSRTPIGNVVAARLAPPAGQGQHPGELTTRLDGDTFGAAASAVLAFLVNYSLLMAIAKVARAHNAPIQTPVNGKTLVPPASSVQMEPTYDDDGQLQHVRFYKLPSQDDGPQGDVPVHAAAVTLHDLERDRDRRLQRVDIWHAMYEGGAYFTPVQPLLTGATNMTRRALGKLPDLQATPALFFLCGLASGLAGGAAKGGMTVLKGLPGTGQIEVPNPIGGARRVNLYEVRGMGSRERDRPGMELAKWRDARRLPKAALEVGAESLQYLSYLVTHPSLRLFGDFGLRFLVPNAAARIAATSYGASLLQLSRPTTALMPERGESAKGWRNVVQQLMSSMYNEYTNTHGQSSAAKLKVDVDQDMGRLQNTKRALNASLAVSTNSLDNMKRGLSPKAKTYLAALNEAERGRLGRHLGSVRTLPPGPPLQRALRSVAQQLSQRSDEGTAELRQHIEQMSRATADIRQIQSRLSLWQRLQWNPPWPRGAASSSSDPVSGAAA